MPREKKEGMYRPHKPVKKENVDEHGVVLPSRTHQSFVAECDINNILKEYALSGQIRHISAKAEQGAYVDLPDQIDFQESLNIVMQGQEAFASLPSQVRNRFHNNPAEFLEFMADPANQDEAIKLGLATDNRPPADDPPAPPAKPGGEGDPPLA